MGCTDQSYMHAKYFEKKRRREKRLTHKAVGRNTETVKEIEGKIRKREDSVGHEKEGHKMG